MKSKPDILVTFVSLGCSKNLVDSEIIATHLLKAGMGLARHPEEADVILVNTCAFIGDAREESAQHIAEACDMKNNGSCRAVVVAGCMSQRYKGALLRAFPEIDLVMGLDELPRAPALIRRAITAKDPLLEVKPRSSAVIEPPLPRVVFTGAPYAYVKVSDGCDHRCSFCAIPLIRGRFRSRSMDLILKECEVLLENGILEINLISQDILSYGKDLGTGDDLPALLHAISALGDRFWIRLLYGHPDFLDDRLLEAMAALPRVCRYLDLPVQHCDPDILKRMGRKGSFSTYLDMVSRIRERLPGVCIRTTCMTGFPGETPEKFEQLLEFVNVARFDHLGVFAYSREEDTPAATFPCNIPDEEVEERLTRLVDAQTRIIDAVAGQRLGTTEEVLIESLDPDRKNVLIGRSFREAPEVDGAIFVHGPVEPAATDGFLKVNITEQDGVNLKAEPYG